MTFATPLAPGYWSELLAATPIADDVLHVVAGGVAVAVPVHLVDRDALVGALCEEWYACPRTVDPDGFTGADAVIMHEHAGGWPVAQPVCSCCLSRALARIAVTTRRPGTRYASVIRVLQGSGPPCAVTSSADPGPSGAW